MVVDSAMALGLRRSARDCPGLELVRQVREAADAKQLFPK